MPRPSGWREGLEVVGYFWPPRPPGWQPSRALLDLLTLGPPPVFVGFGSLVPPDVERLAEIVAEAVRGIMSRGPT